MLRKLQGSWPFLDQLLTKTLKIAFRLPAGCCPLAQKRDVHRMREGINNSTGKTSMWKTPRDFGTLRTSFNKE